MRKKKKEAGKETSRAQSTETPLTGVHRTFSEEHELLLRFATQKALATSKHDGHSPNGDATLAVNLPPLGVLNVHLWKEGAPQTVGMHAISPPPQLTPHVQTHNGGHEHVHPLTSACTPQPLHRLDDNFIYSPAARTPQQMNIEPAQHSQRYANTSTCAHIQIRRIHAAVLQICSTFYKKQNRTTMWEGPHEREEKKERDERVQKPESRRSRSDPGDDIRGERHWRESSAPPRWDYPHKYPCTWTVEAHIQATTTST